VAEPQAQASPRSWFDLLVDALALVAAALVVLLTALILLDIAARYLRLFSLPWSLEASEYMLYAITFLGAPWVLREEGHIAIELVLERLPPLWRARIRRLTDALGAVVCALLLYYSCRVAWRSYDAGTMVRKSFEFPEWYVFAGVPAVMLILLGIYLRWLARPLRPKAPGLARRQSGA
jgi:TRAP-type C4-dicarboxylate transport system permease small subunit